MPEIIAHVHNIGTLVKVSGHPELIRCNPADFDINDPTRLLPPPHLLPCFFDKKGLEIAVQRYKGIVELLEKGSV